MSQYSPMIGIGVLLWNRQSLLLGERVVSGADNCWQFPGGHLRAGEAVTACGRRELEEETGIIAGDMYLIGCTDQPFEVAGRQYLTLFVGTELAGDVVLDNREPEKCLRWEWFDYRHLPRPLFAPIEILLAQLSRRDDDLLDFYRRSLASAVSTSTGHR